MEVLDLKSLREVSGQANRCICPSSEISHSAKSFADSGPAIWRKWLLGIEDHWRHCLDVAHRCSLVHLLHDIVKQRRHANRVFAESHKRNIALVLLCTGTPSAFRLRMKLFKRASSFHWAFKPAALSSAARRAWDRQGRSCPCTSRCPPSSNSPRYARD